MTDKAIHLNFAKDAAPRFQEGKIIAQNMVPPAVQPPIKMDWVVLEPGIVTNEEIHPINKVFSVVAGKGQVFVGDEIVDLKKGDVIWCPTMLPHHFAASKNEALEFTVTKWL
jgi:quercetin dioxygenase-like cupin family protein